MRPKYCNWEKNLSCVDSFSINKWRDGEAEWWGGGLKVSLDKHFVFCWRSEGAFQRIRRQINRLICSGFAVFVGHVLVPWEAERWTCKRKEGWKEGRMRMKKVNGTHRLKSGLTTRIMEAGLPFHMAVQVTASGLSCVGDSFISKPRNEMANQIRIF